MQNIAFAFLMTLLAGLSTGIGGALCFFAKRSNTKFLSASMGFSAGVMIYVSMIEVFAEANHMLEESFGAKQGNLVTNLAFFGGMLLIALIDKLIPREGNPHEISQPISLQQDESAHAHRLKRTGIMTAVVIALHNFPEGIAAFVSAMQSPRIAVPIVVAIAIHNIPEGISVAMPVYYATGSRWKALMWSFLSGLSEPLGAVIGYLILLPFMTDAVYGVLFASVAGIMVFISMDELLPGAEVFGEHHLSMYGMVGGMIVMALSLWMFK
jgi:ZIP family zinc transporter